MSDTTYILDGHTPVPEPDSIKWARWLETADCTVARTEIGGSVISTVFLGLDHQFLRKGPPLLFETVIFTDGEGSDDMWRCSTWAEAEKQHADAVAQWKAQ